MTLHKRNQLEEAIVRTLGADDAQARALKLKISLFVPTKDCAG